MRSGHPRWRVGDIDSPVLRESSQVLRWESMLRSKDRRCGSGRKALNERAVRRRPPRFIIVAEDVS